jgi:hypothetical protein
LGKPEGPDRLEYLSVDGRIILKCTVKYQDLRARTAFIWLGRDRRRAFGITLIKPGAQNDPENSFTGLERIMFSKTTAAVSS